MVLLLFSPALKHKIAMAPAIIFIQVSGICGLAIAHSQKQVALFSVQVYAPYSEMVFSFLTMAVFLLVINFKQIFLLAGQWYFMASYVASHSCTVCSLLSNDKNVQVCDATYA